MLCLAARHLSYRVSTRRRDLTTTGLNKTGMTEQKRRIEKIVPARITKPC